MSLAAATFRATLALIETSASFANQYGPSGKRRIYRDGASKEETPHPRWLRVTCIEDEEQTNMGPKGDYPDHAQGVLTVSFFSDKDRAFNDTTKGFEGQDTQIKDLINLFRGATIIDPNGDYEFAVLKRLGGGPGPVTSRTMLHHMERFRIRARRKF